MPDVTLIVDGKTVTVPAGTNVVDAARAGATAIPVFCYHPKMKPVGMCRMCMVEVYTPKMDPATRQPVIGADGKPELALMANKLQPGCMTPVSPGMVVNTISERVKFAQKGQLEFLLTSHPLDCPVCDKGGECPLQNLTMEWGPGNSRYDYSDKVHFQKPIPLGDLIYLDRERCILCARCVRFQDEIAGDPVLGFDNRGRNWEIISKSEPAFDSKFSGNTTDICPVGALTSSDFRFKARVWELRSVPSVCSHCSAGCNISLDMRYDNLMRVMPRENDFVNEIWLCDKGRYGMRFFGSEDRIKTPMIRRNDQWAQVSWDEALQFIAEKLTQIRNAAGGSALAGLAGPKLPNEDLYLFQKLFREVLSSNNLDYRSGTPDEPVEFEDLMPTLGVGAGTNLMTLGKGTSVLVIGADPEEEASIYVIRLRGIVDRGGELNVVNPLPTKLDRSATRTAHPRVGTGPQFVLAMLKIIAEDRLLSPEFTARLRGVPELLQQLSKLDLAELVATTGVAEDSIRAIAQSFAKAENGIIIYGRTAISIPALPQALANLAMLTGKVGRANSGMIALLPDANARGALDLGVRPDKGPGGATLAAPGLGARDIWGAAAEGRVRGMYIVGKNPAKSNPTIIAALEQLEFLVVQDLFLTETAQLADVVLPAASFAEREGTFTNAERRVQRFRQARKPDAELPPDWLIFQDLARAVQALTPAAPAAPVELRKSAKARANADTSAIAVAAPPAVWDYLISSDIADEISNTVRGYRGTAYTSLELTRKSWGRQPNEAFYYDGTSYTNTEGVGVQIPTLADDGKSTFPITFSAPVAPVADERFPLTLLTPTRSYDGGEWMRGSKLLTRLAPSHAILSMPDAQRLGVGMGEKILLTSAAGTLELAATIDAGLNAGIVLIPDVQGVELSSILTGPQTRVNVTKIAE